ncbi:MAG TPA: trypsin-like serine protease [Polyangiaceae bacterium]|nr:trypsin-like serine protease [Polyangiaceae bacterium]
MGAAIACLAACSGAPTVPLSATAVQADVVSPPAGVPDRGDDPAVVAVDVGGEPCAGSLIAPDVVLTALHCVASRAGPVSCASTAADAGGGAIALVAASEVRILLGDDMATAVERARGRSVLAPPGAHLCGADIAVVLLDEPIDGVMPFAIRATGAARGDHLRTVGYGGGGGAPAKLLRDHVTVLDTSAAELAVEETLMLGGGGPALDETTEEIVGVVSRSGAPAEAIDTRPDAFASFLAGALAMSESAPASSTGTAKVKKGPADLGADCASGVDCAAGVCVLAAGGTQQYCSRSCGPHDRCPSLYACQRTSGSTSAAGAEVCVRR